MRLDQPQFVSSAQELDQALGDIQVGWKVTPFGHNDTTIGTEPQSGAKRLEKVDAGRIRYDGFSRLGTDQRANLLTNANLQLHPSVLVPTTDQVTAPFDFHELLNSRRGCARHGPQRIAVEIDDPFR